MALHMSYDLYEGATQLVDRFLEAAPRDIGNYFDGLDLHSKLVYYTCWVELVRSMAEEIEQCPTVTRN